MGISFSCPFSEDCDLESGLESVTVKSISFGDDEVKTPVRSISFNRGDAEPSIMRALGSGKMTLETSVSFKGDEIEKMGLFKQKSTGITSVSPLCKEVDIGSISPITPISKEMDIPSPRSDSMVGMIRPVQTDFTNPKHMAAIKLQKVYKSFRTRRKLADCAVLVEQSWWKLLDFAELKRSSISFFEIEKHETAISRWSRARTRAAKVGKGLSKNSKAQKLALQHWLEAIDPRHRYGHNLHFYYIKWLHCQSREPFFYWLDIGEGKEVNLEKCPRSKLQQQCIKYLGPMERMAYEVVVEDGKLFYKQSGELLHTSGEDEDAKWIFVLSTSKVLYVGKKQKGTFQHSSFLAGGATSAAGRLVIESGIIKAVWPHSGHYRPTEENFRDFVSFLEENNVDLTDVKMSPVDEEEDLLSKKRMSAHLRSYSAEDELIPDLCGLKTEDTIVQDSSREETDSMEQAVAMESRISSPLLKLSRKLSNLEIPKRESLLESESQAAASSRNSFPVESSVSTEVHLPSEHEYMVPKQNLFAENHEETKEETIPEESILKRINSLKGMKSYQLGKQLSCKWTTGAGPRIGCVRDYPSELQFRALEHVNLSPRKANRSSSYLSPRIGNVLGPTLLSPTTCGGAFDRASLLSRSFKPARTQSSPLFVGSRVTQITNVS
ncbi:IQ domain-containing protein IQM2 [Argentina anserina]|uniref:IQ domain-containing protein IQM2 n=1 Tax=Argentina anserina TaxID=57926 RepID=UPI00217661A4|nr:IQ domain-containing protein IQM2 [Potentilla anserina]